MANYSPTINLIVAVHAKNQNKVTIYSPGIILGIKSKTKFLVRLHGEYNILVKLCGNTT